MNLRTFQPSRSLPSPTRFNKRQALSLMAGGLVAISLTPNLLQASTIDDRWTQFVPNVDTRLIFVSNSEGSDANSGYTPERPVKTLARAYELLRDGQPDWMLLKRGDVWNESFPDWDKSGRAEDQLMVVGAYGEEGQRPQIRPDGAGIALKSYGDQPVTDVAFVGLHLEPQTRTGDDDGIGIRWLQTCENILFEDVYIDGFKDNIIFQAYPSTNDLRDIRLNGCVVVDAWSNSGHSQGLYASGVHGLTIDSSVFHHNGWNLDEGAEPTIFNHNIYVQNSNSDVTLKDSIIADASSHGIQLRPGGTIEGNLFLSNPLSALVGGGSYPNEGGVECYVRNNLVMYGRDIADDLPRAFGFTISNIREGVISGNIFHKATVGYNRDLMKIGGDRDLMVKNLNITENTVIGWPGSMNVRHPADGQVIESVAIYNNTFYQDLTPNPNGNINKSFIRTFEESDQVVSINNNTYYNYQMHDRPFNLDGSFMTNEEWYNSVEPSANMSTLSTPPPDLGIDVYLAQFEIEGGLQDFIESARNTSRANYSHVYSAPGVIGWFTNTSEPLLSAIE